MKFKELKIYIFLFFFMMFFGDIVIVLLRFWVKKFILNGIFFSI